MMGYNIEQPTDRKAKPLNHSYYMYYSPPSSPDWGIIFICVVRLMKWQNGFDVHYILCHHIEEPESFSTPNTSCGGMAKCGFGQYYEPARIFSSKVCLDPSYKCTGLQYTLPSFDLNMVWL